MSYMKGNHGDEELLPFLGMLTPDSTVSLLILNLIIWLTSLPRFPSCETLPSPVNYSSLVASKTKDEQKGRLYKEMH